jgi:hypothetical protein
MRGADRAGVRRAWVLRALPLGLLLGFLAGCGAEPSPREEPAEAGLPAVTASPSEAEAEESRSGPAVRLAERREMEEADAVFPHSEHRSLECQRCHRRPPGHATHTDAACTTCHGRPAGFANLPARSSGECAACHHVGVTSGQCRTCHASDDVGARPVLVAIQAAGAAAARVRPIAFDHARHTRVDCTTCHTTPATLQFGRECGSCHEPHHRQEARCATCHPSVPATAHDASVHSGCAGGGCHTAAPTLAPTRNVCLTCHLDMAEHKAGRECIECHAGSWSAPAPPSRGGR